MRHRLAVAAFLLLVSAALLALASQPSLADTTPCPRLAYPPVLDGRLDDWAPLPQLVVADAQYWHPAAPEYAEYGGPLDISSDIRLGWDSQDLYLAIETKDNQIVRVRSAAEIDRGDSIVLSIAPEDSRQTNEFVIALLRNASLVWRVSPHPGEVRSIARALAVTDEDGAKKLVYELAIPWGDLPDIRPLPGLRLRLTVSACDDDGAGLKGCLERTTVAKLSSPGAGGAEDGEGPVGAAPPFFPNPDSVRFDERCFTLDGRDYLLFGGEVDYWLLPEAAWPSRLDAAKAAGLNLISIAVPWSHYQPLPAPPDLTDLARFLDLCQSRGLWAQVNIGPFLGETTPAGGIPAWVLSLSPTERDKAAQSWLQALLPTVAERQISRRGPVISLSVGPTPGPPRSAGPPAYQNLLAAVRGAGIGVPCLAANAPAARAAVRSMANLLDTISLYRPGDAQTLSTLVQQVSREETGPAVISSLPGDYRAGAEARRSADLVRVALALGGSSVTLAGFAPGLDPTTFAPTGPQTSPVIDPAGALAPGYGEVRLLGAFLAHSGTALARATSAEEVVQTDDPDVRALVRYGKDQSFLFLWDEKGRADHRLRLSYLAPDSDRRQTIPDAGAIYLPQAGAAILPLDTPFGRGLIRYSTSQVAALHQLGDRWLLALYGDPDTPGEIAIRMPGSPLVRGDVARQTWRPDDSTIVIDYYHADKDQYILVDELEIAILSRARASTIALAASDQGSVTLVAGGPLAEASGGSQSIRASVALPPGTTRLTAALPQAPSAVLVDGKPAQFTYQTPERVLTINITTPAFSDEQRPRSTWDRLGRALAGGPPYLYARFDRALFRPDADAPAATFRPSDTIAGPPDRVGLAPGDIARLRAHFPGDDASEMAITGSTYPLLVAINGRLVEALSTYAPESRADISSFLRPGPNSIEIVAPIAPLRLGLEGAAPRYGQLPQVTLSTPSGDIPVTGWEVSRSLAGEAAGYAAPGLDERAWHYLRLGPWRGQSRELADAWGAGWYRMSFRLPEPDEWTIPYYLDLDLRGAGRAYLNGTPVASFSQSGSFRLPLPSTLPQQENVLALALYGPSSDTGLYSAQVAADERGMTKRRAIEIRF
ncbi:MAG: beta-galactosidase [Armatimonadota bacterium]